MRTVTMGNDEFILFVRKNQVRKNVPMQQRKENDVLGRRIWEWIIEHDSTALELQPKPQACYWGDQGAFVDEYKLPKVATQFEFNSSILPDLYKYLETL